MLLLVVVAAAYYSHKWLFSRALAQLNVNVSLLPLLFRCFLAWTIELTLCYCASANARPLLLLSTNSPKSCRLLFEREGCKRSNETAKALRRLFGLQIRLVVGIAAARPPACSSLAKHTSKRKNRRRRRRRRRLRNWLLDTCSSAIRLRAAPPGASLG